MEEDVEEGEEADETWNHGTGLWHRGPSRRPHQLLEFAASHSFGDAQHENRITTELYLHSIGQAERIAIATLEKSNGNSHTSLTQMKVERSGARL